MSPHVWVPILVAVTAFFSGFLFGVSVRPGRRS